MSFLLLESGDTMLLESGDAFLLEDGAVVVVSDHGYVCLAVGHPSCTLTVSRNC